MAHTERQSIFKESRGNIWHCEILCSSSFCGERPQGENIIQRPHLQPYLYERRSLPYPTLRHGVRGANKARQPPRAL